DLGGSAKGEKPRPLGYGVRAVHDERPESAARFSRSGNVAAAVLPLPLPQPPSRTAANVSGRVRVMHVLPGRARQGRRARSPQGRVHGGPARPASREHGPTATLEPVREGGGRRSAAGREATRQSPMQTDFSSVYISTPTRPCSRPKPDCLKPPNGMFASTGP